MGRAIVRDPKAFLMDEPLSNLDAKLRVQMRTEVARIQSRLDTTTVYVTHDQTEAMTLGDRVAVMRAGELQQVGSPAELYDHPKNIFVAGFIGSPAMNFMPATVEGGKVKLPIGEVDLPDGFDMGGDGSRDVIAGLRPEAFEDAEIAGDDAGGTRFSADIDLIESMGSELYVYLSLESEQMDSKHLQELAEDAGAEEVPGADQGQVVARLSPESKVKRGEQADLWVDASKVQLFDPESGESLSRSEDPA
jgi:multiple sugar transport system ATP-binding protein